MVLAVLFGLVALCALTLLGRVWAAVLVVPLAGVWVLTNRTVEGPTLWALSWNHGVTLADLLSVIAVALAAWRLLPVLARLSS